MQVTKYMVVFKGPDDVEKDLRKFDSESEANEWIDRQTIEGMYWVRKD